MRPASRDAGKPTNSMLHLHDACRKRGSFDSRKGHCPASSTHNGGGNSEHHPTASNNSDPLFLGLLTCLLTGQTFRTSSPADLRSAPGSFSTSLKGTLTHVIPVV